MVLKKYGPRTSSAFDIDAKSLQLLVARSGRAITDAEGILLQDIQSVKLHDYIRTQTFSGCVDLPPFRFPGDSAEELNLPSNCLIIPPFRALLGGDLVLVQGSQNPNAPQNLDNYIFLPQAPYSSYGMIIVYLESWYQVLDDSDLNQNHGFFPNLQTAPAFIPGTSPRWYFPYGNILGHENWIKTDQFLDDLKHPLAGYTSGRVQLQYALRACSVDTQVPLTEYLKDFGLTHPSITAQTFSNTFASGAPKFSFAGVQDPGLYISSNSSELRTVDGLTRSIPLAVIYQRNQGKWSPVDNAHGTALYSALSDIGGSLASSISGRPDGRYYDMIHQDDILDTRSTFLGGSLEDYESLIKQTMTRLWQGALRLKLAEPSATDPNSHQLGQTLSSFELLGQFKTSPIKLDNSLSTISPNTEPRMSFTSDIPLDTLTYLVTPDMKAPQPNGDPQDNLISWAASDRVILSHTNLSAHYESVVITTLNAQAQILRVPSTYIKVSGLGTSQIMLDFLDIGVDFRFDLSAPLWVTTTIRTPKSIEHLRYVPVSFHPPIYTDAKLGSHVLHCGKVSDHSQEFEEFSVMESRKKFKSYKRNFDPNMFGTVVKCKVPLSSLVQSTGTFGPQSGIAPTVNFTANILDANLAQSVNLSWSVANATKVTINNGIGEVPIEGSISVRITQSTDYILTAYFTNLDGTLEEVSQVLTIEPPTNLIGGSVYTGALFHNVYQYPGGSLNPENISGYFAEATLLDPLGFGNALQNVPFGCIKATLYQKNIEGFFETSELQIRHQYFIENSSNTGLSIYKIGVFGSFNTANTDYVEFELLVTAMKTFHYNPTVMGISAITETVALSKEAQVYFSDPTTGDSSNYTFRTYPDSANSTMHLIVSVPADSWGSNKIGGCFEGVFGYNGQSFVFVKLQSDEFYRTVPCTVQGYGTPLLKLTLPQIETFQIEDILVLAQTTTTLESTSSTLISYDYVPYQGEGSSDDTYSLVHLSDQAQVTTFGTGSRSVPGLSSVSSVNPHFPISAALPANTGWKDSDLKSSKFRLSGSFSGTGNSSGSTTDFLCTVPLATSVGNLKHLLEISADDHPALSPRVSTQRGFSKNIVAFAYVIDPPQIVETPHQMDSETRTDLSLWVDLLVGVDSNSGLTRDTPKRSLQKVIDTLPAIIRHNVIINVSGVTTISADTLDGINMVGVTPYGDPSKSKVYSIVRTSFRTEGDGLVIIQKDPAIQDMARVKIPAMIPFNDAPTYGWIHTSGRLLIRDFDFESLGGEIFAAYPGSEVSFTNCSFEGGSAQLIAYKSNVKVTETSFSNPQGHHIIATSGATVTLNQNISFSKHLSTGYTFIVEKGSTLVISNPFLAMSAYPSTARIEALVQQYSVLETLSSNFTFEGLVKLTSFSTLLYNVNHGWAGTPLLTDQSVMVDSSL